MNRSLNLVACLGALSAIACGGGAGSDEDGDPCAGITCSGHGSCVASGGSATCECESGFHTSGLICVDDDFAGSCNMPLSYGCDDFTGSSFTPSAVQSTCSGFSGAVYSPGPCSTGNRVGRCTLNAGTGTEAVISWYQPMTAAAAQAGCTGNWTAG